MNWVEIAVIAPAAYVELVGEVLRPYSPTGTMAEEQWGDPEDLAPRALLPDVHCKIYLQEVDYSPQLLEKITQQMSLSVPSASRPLCTVLAETDWTTAWQKNYETFRLGKRFVIQPSWLVDDGWPNPKPDDIPIVIDPGMAFGTGLHETTRLCMRALEDLLVSEMSVLDVGTGSGILSFAAAKLGAKPIFAVDNDPVAIRVARQNAESNGLTGQIAWQVGGLDSVKIKDWDLVVVNILAVIIEEMITRQQLLTFAAADGAYLFSGIIAAQREMMRAAIERAGGAILQEWQEGDWIAHYVKVK